MASRFRLLTQRIILFFTILTVVCYLVVCLLAYADAGNWSLVTALVLLFPLLVLMLIIFLIFWLFQKKKIRGQIDRTNPGFLKYFGVD